MKLGKWKGNTARPKGKKRIWREIAEKRWRIEKSNKKIQLEKYEFRKQRDWSVEINSRRKREIHKWFKRDQSI